MKTKLIVLSLFAIAALWTASVVFAYHGGLRHGYQRGAREERECWTMDPAPVEAWTHGEITALRDTTKHPFLSAHRVSFRSARTANSTPVTYSP